MTDTAILTGGLTKHCGEVEALNDLDLEVTKGEVFGFLGPNWAGKTTMIRTILDLIHPTAGRASILGMDSREDAVEIRNHIGYLPGDLALYPNLTGRDTPMRSCRSRSDSEGGRGGPRSITTSQETRWSQAPTGATSLCWQGSSSF